MIYPQQFPLENRGHPEEYVYNFLKTVGDEYDIFYDIRFAALTNNENLDYQIDFIIAKPYRAILIVEVKGGLISYEGSSHTWLKNRKRFKKNPVDQVTEYWKSLISRYNRLSRTMPFEWALCFPESEKKNGFDLPNSVSNKKVIDRYELNFLRDKLNEIFKEIDNNYPLRDHKDRIKEYDRFKSALIRDYGFVRTLSTQFIEEENKFIELTDQQKIIFSALKKHNQLFIQGVAGSGKTIIAINIAHEAVESDKAVLFLCFNRTLANVINRQFKHDKSITIDTFHSYAEKRISESDSNWFETENTGMNEWFEEDVPLRLSEVQEEYPKSFDLILIDEGQDFMELWFEVIFQELNSDGKVMVFADFDQDIFGRFDKLPLKGAIELVLDENCRNTQLITQYINASLGKNIINKKGVPEGDIVEEEHFLNYFEMIKKAGEKIAHLIENDKLSTRQIIIIVNKRLNETKLREFNLIGKYKIRELNKEAIFEDQTIYFTTSSRFKGLDSDVVFVLNEPINKSSIKLYDKKSYVRITRAKHKLYFYSAD